MAAADGARDWTRDLSERAFDAQRRLLRTYGEIFDRPTELRVDERVVSPAFVQFARDVTDLSLRYFDGLLELGRRYQDEMLRSPTAAEQRGEAPVTRDGSADGFRVDARGRRDRSARARSARSRTAPS